MEARYRARKGPARRPEDVVFRILRACRQSGARVGRAGRGLICPFLGRLHRGGARSLQGSAAISASCAVRPDESCPTAAGARALPARWRWALAGVCLWSAAAVGRTQTISNPSFEPSGSGLTSWQTIGLNSVASSRLALPVGGSYQAFTVAENALSNFVSATARSNYFWRRYPASDAAGIRWQRIGLQAVRYAVRPGRRDVKLPLCDRGGGGERQRLGVLISQRDAGEPRELDERRALVGLWRGGLHERSQLHDDHDHARHRNTYLGVWRL